MRKILSLLIVYFLLINQAFAVTGVPDNLHWEAAGFGGAGAFPMVVSDLHTANKLYAIGDVNAPFVSTNKADSWGFLSTVGAVNSGYTPTQTASFVQSQTTPTLMFALDSASGGLARSADGGQTWAKVGSFGNGKGSKVIAIDKDNDNNVYVASFSNLYKSTDSGLTFTNIGRVFNSRASAYTTQSACVAAGAGWSTSLGLCTITIKFVYHDNVNNDLYLGSAKWGMVKYDLDTDTQTYVDLTGTNGTYNVAFDTYIDGSAVENLCVGAGLKVACTSDFSTWNYTAALSTDANYFINTFAIHRKADTSLNIVANRQLKSSAYTNVTLYSTDGGTTWATASRSNNTTMNPTGVYNSGNLVFSIENDRTNDGVIYLATDWRIYRSDNSGSTFAEKDSGLQMVVAHDVTIAPNGRMFMVEMDTGVQYSDDFGATWTQGTPNSSAGQPFVTGSVNDYGGHYWRVITLGTEAEWNAGTGKVIISATMYSTPTSLRYVNYVIYSHNSGATWSRSNSGLPTVALYGDAVWGQGYARALAKSADETTLYLGMDGENCQANPALPYNCTTNFTSGGLFKSTDYGVTWTRVWSSPRKIFNALAVDPKDTTNQILLFGTWGYNMYRKTGTSTANYVGDSNGPTNYIMDVAYDSTGSPYAVVNNSGPAIYKSVITSFGNGSGLYGTWQLMKKFGTNGIADGLVIDPRNDDRVFVSISEGSSPANRRIYVTPNADEHTNATWYDITGDFPVVGGCRALTINYFEGTQGYLYCASNGGGLWKQNLADSPSTHPGRTCFGGCTND